MGVVGLATPCMELHVDMEMLYAHRPALKAYSGILDALDLPGLLHSEVSIWRCVRSLAAWTLDGDLNCMVALVLYAGFAVLLPAVDVAALMVAVTSRRCAKPARSVSRVLRKMCMLDVSLMGTVVIVATLSSM